MDIDARIEATHRSAKPGFRWDGVAHSPYKDEGSAPFKAISRQTLFADAALGCELRYFEVDAGGHSTLERHEHVHAVMILRGHGKCLLGDEIRDIGPHDLVTIPGWLWHQFRATAGETLGFLCMVNHDRDRPLLPSEEQRSALMVNPAVAAFMDS